MPLHAANQARSACNSRVIYSYTRTRLALSQAASRLYVHFFILSYSKAHQLHRSPTTSSRTYTSWNDERLGLNEDSILEKQVELPKLDGSGVFEWLWWSWRCRCARQVCWAPSLAIANERVGTSSECMRIHNFYCSALLISQYTHTCVRSWTIWPIIIETCKCN